jgi:hypothetical protein
MVIDKRGVHLRTHPSRRDLVGSSRRFPFLETNGTLTETIPNVSRLFVLPKIVVAIVKFGPTGR